jgi:UDP-N-acetyl-L-fucosamine synthase
VLDHYRKNIVASDILKRLDLKPREYFIVSLHREENVDSAARLRQLVAALNALVSDRDMPMIVSTHPRTRKRLDALDGLSLDSRIKSMKPFSFYDYNNLQMNSFCAISDSGTIAEEASILGFPAISPRDAIERPEGLDVGCIMMTGLCTDTIINGIDAVTRIFYEKKESGTAHPVPQDYLIANTSDRVLGLIIGTAKLSNEWDGIRMNDLG